MSASYVIEEDHGTYTRSRHPHNGYYAGDFSGPDRATRGFPMPAVTRTAATAGDRSLR